MVQGKEAKKSHFCGGSLTGKRRVVARKHRPASVYWGPQPSLRPTSIPTFMRAETWQATNTADSRPDSLPGKYLSGAQPGFHSSISALWLSSGLANSEPAINGCLLINTHLGNTIKNNFKEKRKLWNYQAEAGTEIKPDRRLAHAPPRLQFWASITAAISISGSLQQQQRPRW